MRTILGVGSRVAWLVNDSMSGEDIRLAVGAGLMHDTALRVRSGVIPAPSNPLKAAIGAGMGVTIQPGQAVIGGARGGAQGVYVHTEDSVRTVTLDAGDPAQPRIDIIALRVRDTGYSDTATDGGIVVVKGTPNASPAVPGYTGTALLGTAYALATVRVPAGASAGSGGLVSAGATLTDLRTYAVAAGGVLPILSSQRAGLPVYAGLMVFETDTKRLYVYTGSAWALVQMADGSASVRGSTVVTTNGAGGFAIDLGFTFAEPPVVIAGSGDIGAFEGSAGTLSNSTTTYNGVATRAGGARAASVGIRIDWIADGPI